MTWVITIFGIVMLVILHELGHFAAAKALGMRVERFSLFFPPTIFRVRRGETAKKAPPRTTATEVRS